MYGDLGPATSALAEPRGKPQTRAANGVSRIALGRHDNASQAESRLRPAAAARIARRPLVA